MPFVWVSGLGVWKIISMLVIASVRAKNARENASSRIVAFMVATWRHHPIQVSDLRASCSILSLSPKNLWEGFSTLIRYLAFGCLNAPALLTIIVVLESWTKIAKPDGAGLVRALHHPSLRSRGQREAPRCCVPFTIYAEGAWCASTFLASPSLPHHRNPNEERVLTLSCVGGRPCLPKQCKSRRYNQTDIEPLPPFLLEKRARTIGCHSEIPPCSSPDSARLCPRLHSHAILVARLVRGLLLAASQTSVPANSFLLSTLKSSFPAVPRNS